MSFEKNLALNKKKIIRLCEEYENDRKSDAGVIALYGLTKAFRGIKNCAEQAEKILGALDGDNNFDNNLSDVCVSVALNALFDCEIAFNSAIARDLIKKLKARALKAAREICDGDYGEKGDKFSFVSALSVFSFFDSDEKTRDITSAAIDKFFDFFGKQETDSASACLALSGALRFAAAEKNAVFLQKCGVAAVDVFSRCLSLNYECGTEFFAENQKTCPFATALLFTSSITLSKLCETAKYAPIARRIWLNGLQFCLRESGGAGANSFACDKSPYLHVADYEDGLSACAWAAAACEYSANRTLFSGAEEGAIRKDARGRFFTGDRMYARDESGFFGRDLIEIPSAASFDRETGEQLRFLVKF